MVIGVFIAQLDDAYQRGIWRGITTRARETGHGTIGFIGQRLDAPIASEATRNIAYHLAGKTNIDGLIFLSSTIGTFRGIKGVQALLEGIDVPKVSVGLRVPGALGVTANGRQAMAELTRHLIRDHGRTRFALVAGPVGHPEADEREAVLRAELAAAGLYFDERLLERGSFLADSGAEAARRLLASGIDFDALVCLNDRMAMAAMAVLREAGLQIPADVVVTGFDDVWESRWESPPLTTVTQPLEAMGRTAVDRLLELLRGEEPEDCLLECHLVKRQSCACPPSRQFVSVPAGSMSTTEIFGLDQSLVERLWECARHNQQEGFLAILNAALLSTQAKSWLDYESTNSDFEPWHQLFHQMSSQLQTVGELMEEANALVSSVEIRHQAAARVQAMEQHQLMRNLGASLAASFNMKNMVRQLSAGLARLRIGHGFLAMFADHATAEGRPSEVSHLVMAACHPGHDQNFANLVPSDFLTSQLLPEAFSQLFGAGLWILEPLVFQEEALGYLILSGDTRDPAVYENLRDQVSSTLKGSLLMEQIIGHEAELESEVFRRTSELHQANRELTAEIAQRRVLEREVQEISDRTMRVIGQDLHDDLCQHLAGISMFAALLETELQQAHPASVEAVARIRHMLEGSIVRTRQIARGLFPPGLEERGLVAAIEDLVDCLNQASKVRISLEVDGDFSALDTARSLQLFRIVQEAIANSTRHSGSEMVLVRLFREAEWGCVEVRDFGGGMGQLSRSNQSGQGMGLRIMRYRAESIGANLTIGQLDSGVCIGCRLVIGAPLEFVHG